jgi:phytoene dehydrogenase-like protein
MGSTSPGRPMRQFLEHLQVWDRIETQPFPEDAAIEVRSDGRRFAYPNSWAAFQEKARAEWPDQQTQLDRIIADVEDVCSNFKWFALKKGRGYQHPLEMDYSGESFAEYLKPLDVDPWLAEVLGFQAFNLGLFADEIPWVKHTLAFRSNFDTTCRIAGGGGSLTNALIERGTELGVEYQFRQLVAGFECEKRHVLSLRTQKGDVFAADQFIAACHPKPILRLISDDDIRPLFKEHIFEMRDSRGAVQIFLRLKEPLRSLGATCVMIRDTSEEQGDPALSVVLVCNPTHMESVAPGNHRLEAMTYMHFDPFEQWKDLPVLKRGTEYESFKKTIADRMIRMIARQAPELPDIIDQVYSSTPLSDMWYTHNERGGVFGISHDVDQQGANRPMIRIRLKNLFFTGHSITMPGICGTFINAFDSCDVIRNDGVLFDQVAT